MPCAGCPHAGDGGIGASFKVEGAGKPDSDHFHDRSGLSPNQESVGTEWQHGVAPETF